jgi:serine/threonine protein kinase
LVRKIGYFWLFLLFDDFSIAILYLETKTKVHRDISYTNILLRERDDSDAGKESRKKVMHGLGLDKIEELRQRLDCREGLLIDFDYGATLSGEKPASNKETSSGEKQGSIFDSRHVDILSGEEAASNKETEQHIKQSGARTVS